MGMGVTPSWATTGVILVLLWTVHLSASACPPGCVCQQPSTAANTITCAQGNLTQVPKGLSVDLLQLDLSGNVISSLGKELSSLSLLEKLDLSSNTLKSLNATVFDHLYNLQLLDLCQNAIVTIQPKVFEELTSVKEVTLASNNLTFLDNEVLSGLKTVRTLNFSDNMISSIENGTFLHMEDLEILDLSYNILTELLPSSLAGLKSLIQLQLKNNVISFIENNTFVALTHLQFLDLRGNRLTIIDAFEFSGMPNLQTLLLDSNDIKQIDSSFMGTSHDVEVLSFNHNTLTDISIPLFIGLENLKKLTLSNMPSLTNIAFNAFQGLPRLTDLDLGRNPSLLLVHPHLFDQLPELATVDLSYNNLSILSQLTFHTNPKLKTAYLDGNQFMCNCGLAWLAESIIHNSSVYSSDLQCLSENKMAPVYLRDASDLNHMCNEIQAVNTTDVMHIPIGSPAHLVCDFDPDPHTIVIWTTPTRLQLTYHAFHPDVTLHLLTEEDLALNSSYHSTHFWHNSSSYFSNLRERKDRVVLMDDGSLYIDYILRSDSGPYSCKIFNANHNSSGIILMKLDYSRLFDVKIMSIVVGVGSAASFLLLNIIYSIITAIARRLINKRRRDAIRNLLENLDTYKTTQFTKLRDNYSTQLGRIRDQYHYQFHRLGDNYHSQMKRVRRGYSHQVDRIRDNYTLQVGRLRNYSSHQIEQIRDRYNNQLLKMRDYSSLQLERLHKKYKLQQQHVLKLLETMNLDNCKTVIETECLRTESMIFDVDLLHDSEMRPLSPVSGSDSEYLTASSSENSSNNSLRMSPPPCAKEEEEEEEAVNHSDTDSMEAQNEAGQETVAEETYTQSQGGSRDGSVSIVIEINPEQGFGETIV